MSYSELAVPKVSCDTLQVILTGSDKGPLDDPEYRRQYVTGPFMKLELAHVVPELAEQFILSDGDPFHPSENSFQIRGLRPDGTIRLRGLYFKDEFRRTIIPSMESIVQTMGAASVDSEAILTRFGRVVGTAIAESQSMPNANTRTAKTIEAFIQSGPAALDIAAIYDPHENFAPTQSIEDDLLIEHTDQLLALSEWPYMITSSALLEHTQERLDTLYQLLDPQLVELAADQSLVLERTQPYLVEKSRLANVIAREYLDHRDPQKAYAIALALIQRHYSAAAWAVAFQDKQVHWPLTPPKIERLLAAERALQIMRVQRLMAAAATKDS